MNYTIRFIYCLLLFFTSPGLDAQKISLFKDFNFDSSYSVVGIGDIWMLSVEKDYKKFSFIIDKQRDLSRLKKQWVFTKKGNRIIGNSFSVNVIKDKKIVKRVCTMYPAYSDMLPAGSPRNPSDFYYLDTVMLENTAKEHPLNYSVRKDTFSTLKDFSFYYEKYKNEESFLFLFPQDMNYEGTFKVTTAMSKMLPSRDVVWETLSKTLKSLDEKEEFEIMITAPPKQDPVPLIVLCSKSLFDKFMGDNTFIKGSWEPMTITSIWKK